MLHQYYPIKTAAQLQSFCDSYIPLVLNQLDIFGVSVSEFGLKGDHIGLQVLSGEEFDIVHSFLMEFSELADSKIIHERRNNTYKFNNFIYSHVIEIQSIEIFEPKPTAIISKLKPGIEHLAFVSEHFDALEKHFIDKNLPIDKTVAFGDSKFFKSRLINMVEIEFRNDYLWESLKA